MAAHDDKQQNWRATQLGEEPVYCIAPQSPEEIICPGSDDDHEFNYNAKVSRRLRYEKQARLYLAGQAPQILSASLRGPFEKASGWQNPWVRNGQPTKSGQFPPPRKIKRLAAVKPFLRKDIEKLTAREQSTPGSRDSLQCQLPSPDSQRDLDLVVSQLDSDKRARIVAWARNVPAEALEKDEFWAPAKDTDELSDASSRKRPAGKEWLKSKVSKRRKPDRASTTTSSRPTPSAGPPIIQSTVNRKSLTRMTSATSATIPRKVSATSSGVVTHSFEITTPSSSVNQRASKRLRTQPMRMSGNHGASSSEDELSKVDCAVPTSGSRRSTLKRKFTLHVTFDGVNEASSDLSSLSSSQVAPEDGLRGKKSPEKTRNDGVVSDEPLASQGTSQHERYEDVSFESHADQSFQYKARSTRLETQGPMKAEVKANLHSQLTQTGTPDSKSQGAAIEVKFGQFVTGQTSPDCRSNVVQVDQVVADQTSPVQHQNDTTLSVSDLATTDNSPSQAQEEKTEEFPLSLPEESIDEQPHALPTDVQCALRYASNVDNPPSQSDSTCPVRDVTPSKTPNTPLPNNFSLLDLPQLGAALFDSPFNIPSFGGSWLSKDNPNTLPKPIETVKDHAEGFDPKAVKIHQPDIVQEVDEAQVVQENNASRDTSGPKAAPIIQMEIPCAFHSQAAQVVEENNASCDTSRLEVAHTIQMVIPCASPSQAVHVVETACTASHTHRLETVHEVGNGDITRPALSIEEAQVVKEPDITSHAPKFEAGQIIEKDFAYETLVPGPAQVAQVGTACHSPAPGAAQFDENIDNIHHNPESKAAQFAETHSICQNIGLEVAGSLSIAPETETECINSSPSVVTQKPSLEPTMDEGSTLVEEAMDIDEQPLVDSFKAPEQEESIKSSAQAPLDSIAGQAISLMHESEIPLANSQGCDDEVATEGESDMEYSPVKIPLSQEEWGVAEVASSPVRPSHQSSWAKPIVKSLKIGPPDSPAVIKANTPEPPKPGSQIPAEQQSPWANMNSQVMVAQSRHPLDSILRTEVQCSQFAKPYFTLDSEPERQPSTPVMDGSEPATPEVELSIKSFAKFSTPSPERRSRKYSRLSGGQLRSTQRLLSPTTVNPWSSIRSRSARYNRRVSFAPLPDDKDGVEDHELPLRNNTRPCSPPPPSIAQAGDEDVDEAFHNHFDAVSRRNAKNSDCRSTPVPKFRLGRQLLPNESQQFPMSPAIGAMAEAFKDADVQQDSDRCGSPCDNVKQDINYMEDVEMTHGASPTLCRGESPDDVSAVLQNIDDFLNPRWDLEETQQTRTAGQRNSPKPRMGNSILEANV